jgi:GntR family transcriptional repressor for pyruvate dehydrogenase complex
MLAFVKYFAIRLLRKSMSEQSTNGGSECLHGISKTRRAVELIKNKIIKGEFIKGLALPSEDALSEMIGVSRSAIREAVKILICRNVLYISRGRGTFIVERNTGVVEDPFGLSFRTDIAGKNRDICQIRMALEPLIAREAAEKATDEQIAMLAKCNTEINRCINAGKSHAKADTMFHDQLALCSSNTLLRQIYPILSSGISFLIDNCETKLFYDSDSLHQEILEAILTHDPDSAYKAMKEHQENNLEYFERSLRKFASNSNAYLRT